MNAAAAVDQVLYTLRCYPDKTRLRNDAIGLLNYYRDLRPNVAPAPVGPQPLFNVTGTIPVVIKAVRYNIPVRMWIPVEYPYRPPMCYVTPATGMAITPNHPNVSPSGVVTLPYLQSWTPATHNLIPLVQAMIQVFSMKTPVYSGGARPPPPQSYPGYGQPAPGPSSGGYPGPSAAPTQSPYPGQPLYPGQPASGPASGPAQSASPYSPYSQAQQQQQHRRPPPKTPMDIKRDQLREKCRAKIRELTKDDLNVRTQRLESEKREQEKLLNNAMSQCDQMKKEIADLSQKIKDLDEFLAKNSGELDVDKITDPSDVHRLQLVHTVSMDMAIEDILYNFDRALLKGVIPLDEYLKLCRQYSSDQFFERALTKRIREVISAPPSR